MITEGKILPKTVKTTKGFLVEALEYRINFNNETCISGIIRSDKKYDDSYISWDCSGKKPTIKSFGNLILNQNNKGIKNVIEE